MSLTPVWGLIALLLVGCGSGTTRSDTQRAEAVAAVAAAVKAATVVKPTEQEAAEIAVEAYVYLYPLVTMDLTRRVSTSVNDPAQPMFGPANAFHHATEFPSAEFKAIVRPNFDTLYSSAWLDLTREPLIVSAPDTRGRYYLLPMLDMWSDVFAVPGQRTSGTAAGSWAVVPPAWKGVLPTGVERIDAPTPHVWVIGRTQTNGPQDYGAVHVVQAGYTITPLSRWPRPPDGPAFMPDPTVDLKTPPKQQVDAMSGRDFFTYGAELMKVNRPHRTDWSQLERLRRIGLEPGRSFEYPELDPVIQHAVDAAPKAALELMESQLPSIGRVVNGWSMITSTIGVYGNDYLKRAIVASVGLGANQPEDAIYPLCVTDADGVPCNGDNDYVLHFEKDELPPVSAFWSVTMYDAEGFQAANELNRFAIGDRDALKYGEDGSLDLYLQHESPGPDKEANWLPAPTGPLGITMRLYGPAPQALDGRWNPPAIKKVR